MSAIDTAGAVTPLLVVDVERLAAALREQLADPERSNTSYTDIFSARKTDIASSPASAVSASRQVLQSDVHALVGWAFAETTGTAQTVFRLFDGVSSNAEQFVRITLAPNESVRDWFIPKGIRCFTGNVYLQIVQGSVEGVVYWL